MVKPINRSDSGVVNAFKVHIGGSAALYSYFQPMNFPGKRFGQGKRDLLPAWSSLVFSLILICPPQAVAIQSECDRNWFSGFDRTCPSGELDQQ